MTDHTPQRWLLLAPAIFVFLWSSGFIAAKLGLPDSDPMSFLLLRFAIVIALMGALALAMRAPWPSTWTAVSQSMLVGILLHGIYLGGVFSAIDRGMPAGLSALIVSLQPVLTAMLAKSLLNETVSFKQWIGIILGFGGLVLVLFDRAGLSGSNTGCALEWGTLAFAVAGLIGITLGSILHKKYTQTQDLRTSGFLQYLGAFLFLAIIALFIEPQKIIWTSEFVLALGWLVLAMSFGAVLLLLQIIRHGEMSKVATLFYLVPPTTVVLAYLVFGEQLTLVELTGMAITAIGVMLASRK
jgi:drug/metabolite transporter (DMT)-like permease